MTFNFNDNVLLTPHLVVDARYQDPHPTNSSYLEVGAGSIGKIPVPGNPL